MYCCLSALQTLKRAERLLSRYTGANEGAWLLMVLSAKRDATRFEELRSLITADLDLLRSATHPVVVKLSTPLAALAHEAFCDDMQKVAAQVLKLAKLPAGGDVAEGLRWLAGATQHAERQAVAKLLGAAGDEAVLNTLAKAEQLLLKLEDKVTAVMKDVQRGIARVVQLDDAAKALLAQVNDGHDST